MTAKHTTPHIAILIETSTSFGRRVIDGISRYIHEAGPWSVYIEQRSIYDPVPTWLRDWDGDGLLVKAAYDEMADIIRSLTIPVVDLNEQITDLGVPTVYNDNAEIGRMAAEHLTDRGYENYAFVGHEGVYWSDQRKVGFEESIGKNNKVMLTYSPGHPTRVRYQLDSWELEMSQLSQWIQDLPFPTGIFVANDYLGVQVLDACRRGDVYVPEQVAVIGVDNDSTAEAVAHPPLSSVEPNPEVMGYLAAEMLGELMQGRTLKTNNLLVPPIGVETRQSTDIVAIDDPFVSHALNFVREQACMGAQVIDVVNATNVSRSFLQRRFKEIIGRTIHGEIMRVKINRAKQMIRSTDLPLRVIAERTGFKHVEYLSMAFKRETGQTISEYRTAIGISKND